MEENNKKYKFYLEERLIQFTVEVTNVIEELPDTKVCNHLGGQLLRSGTSPTLNYGEAQAAESRKDFIHKLSISLKELRESRNNLKILYLKKSIQDEKRMLRILNECEELIKIIRKSIQTAEENDSKIRKN